MRVRAAILVLGTLLGVAPGVAYCQALDLPFNAESAGQAGAVGQIENLTGAFGVTGLNGGVDAIDSQSLNFNWTPSFDVSVVVGDKLDFPTSVIATRRSGVLSFRRKPESRWLDPVPNFQNPLVRDVPNLQTLEVWDGLRRGDESKIHQADVPSQRISDAHGGKNPATNPLNSLRQAVARLGMLIKPTASASNLKSESGQNLDGNKEVQDLLAVEVPGVTSSVSRNLSLRGRALKYGVSVLKSAIWAVFSGLAVPQTTQETDYSCGAAALLSVLRYWRVYDGDEAGLYAALEMTPKDGAEPPKVAEVARQYGLKAELRKGMTIADLKTSLARGQTVILDIQAWRSNPSIPWKDDWKDGHYVVLIGMDARNVYLMDPSISGAYGFIPLNELNKRWHDCEDRHGFIQRYIHAGIVIQGEKRSRKRRLKSFLIRTR